ncbi:flagellar export protein FliJ [Soehngenia longivitae]|uniref:Flagellar FliJ protein n=1 Tax=Soehngenia longivitae TaxID=2562294 RepID=A0A4Z0D2E0_9FIRM|nr:flagellar export protein FliJ [Soehngenia longivitae]TFZ39920.1 flagellar export protein FliJ [Soehngenia longivitae]
MENYIFSMEKVLDYREDIEKLKREEFAKINLEISQLEIEIAKINIELKEINEKIFKIQNANELFQMQLYREALEEKLEIQKLLLSEKRKALEDKRVELTKAQADKKIMEKLKEKDYSQFMYKKNLKEQKELDEFSVMKFKHAKN